MCTDSDALSRTEGKTPSPTASPTILPYPAHATSEERATMHAETDARHASIERFVFPALPVAMDAEPVVEAEAPVEASAVAWPKCNDAAVAKACAATADTIVRQFQVDRPKVVLLTSPCDGDGKTSVLVALAPQLARRIDGSILVVDASTHKPDLTSRLSLPEVGASDRSVLIYPTNVPRLSVLPMRRKGNSQVVDADAAVDRDSTANARLKAAKRFVGSARPDRTIDRDWIDEWREAWSLVLLDGSSLGHAEAVALASCCDGVYLVVRLGYTPERAVAEAARVVRRAGGRLLGCVAVN